MQERMSSNSTNYDRRDGKQNRLPHRGAVVQVGQVKVEDVVADHDIRVGFQQQVQPPTEEVRLTAGVAGKDLTI